MTKLPLGIQHFPRIIKEKFLYIDKTETIYQMITSGVAYFFSRPRRFGKSLLISTLEALFQGKKELFSGLWIDSSDYKWSKYPVIRLDFSKTISSSPEALETSLQELISEAALAHDINAIIRPFPSLTLSALVTKLAQKSPVVILIDEYDKPIVNHLHDMQLVAKNREILRDFFTTIKALDQHLRFVFVTGVSKFSKVSLFSGMNNLKDISLYDKYSTLLGLTEKEIRSSLQKEIQNLTQEQKIDEEQTYKNLKLWYNGYRFSSSSSSQKVFNPLSIFSFIDTGKFDNYWFSTATPTFAINLIKKQNFPITDLENGIAAGKEIETNHELDEIDLSTLLFQTGYLTIESYDEAKQTYFLKFPNEEVRRSFIEHLLKAFSNFSSIELNKTLFKLSNNLQALEFEKFFKGFNVMLASIPHQLHKNLEAHYHSLIYLFIKTLGFKVEAEVSTSKGDVDMVLVTDHSTVIFEFKVNKSAEQALNQILNKNYSKKFENTKRSVILVGANFDTESRSLNEWKLQQLS